SLDSLGPLEKTLSRSEAELRAGIDQIGVRLDARHFSGEGVALRLQQIELRDGPDLIAVVSLLRRMRGGDPAGPRGSAAGDGGSYRLPLPVDGVARGEPCSQLAGTGDVGARVLAADAGDAGEIERPGEIDRRLPGPVVAGEARSGGPALAERPRNRRQQGETLRPGVLFGRARTAARRHHRRQPVHLAFERGEGGFV